MFGVILPLNDLLEQADWRLLGRPVFVLEALGLLAGVIGLVVNVVVIRVQRARRPAAAGASPKDRYIGPGSTPVIE